jgi:hypothetical protein
VFKDNNSQYWLFYAQADNATECRDYNTTKDWHDAVDGDTYTIFYKKSSSINTLLEDDPVQVEESFTQRPADFNQRELGAACLDDNVFVFVSHGPQAKSVYYYKTSDSGITWDDPVKILNYKEGILHVHAKAGNIGNGQRIYISGGQSGQGKVYEFDGDSTSDTAWQVSKADVLAQTIPIDGSLYMIARNNDAIPEGIKLWVNADLDATTDNEYTIENPVLVNTYDHTFGKINSTWYAFAAPDDGTKQYIDMYTSVDLAGPWNKEPLTDPGAGMWDYWPDLYVEVNTGYLFYTSEKSGYGHIAMLPLS